MICALVSISQVETNLALISGVHTAHVQNKVVLDFGRVRAAKEAAFKGPEVEMALHVNGHDLFAVETRETLVARVAPLGKMLDQVLLQLRQRREILPALPERALDGARCLGLVSLHVVPEVRHFQEHLVTKGTSVEHQLVRCIPVRL